MKPSSRPTDWLRKAVFLLTAAERLASTFPPSPFPASVFLDEHGNPLPAGSRFNSFEVDLNFNMIEVSKMLAGLSAENALKGMICLRGEHPGRSHNLVLLFGKAYPKGSYLAGYEPVVLNKLLLKLVTAVMWSARYPHPIDGPGDYSTSTEDHGQAVAVAHRLCEELRDRITASRPPASAG